MRRIVGICAAALLAATAGSAGGQGAANLLANPGAEAGEAAPDANARFPVPVWETTSTYTAVQYGAPQFPTPAESARIGGGENFFAGGPGGAVSTARQVVGVSGRAAAIDAGGLAATISAWLGGFSSQNDATTVAAVFRSATGAELSRTTIGPVLAADRGNQTSFRPRTATSLVPSGTRSILVVLTARRTEGTYNDGYADNVSLTLSPVPPPVAGVRVNVGRVAGVVRVRVRGTNRFVNLAAVRSLPVGSEVDVTRGRMRLTSAAGARRTQTAQFFEGRAVVMQPRGRSPVTTLRLSGPLACPQRGASSTDARPPRRRRLWGDGRGRFRTSGRFASAAIRGTRWLTEDRCDATFIRVLQGRVEVLDRVRNRRVVIRAGQSYLARAR